MEQNKIKVAITQGDVNGIGYEVILKVFDDPTLMKTPVVRNGKQATVGYCPEIWATWE